MIHYNPMPILFETGQLRIYSFGFMLAVAALVFLFLVTKKAKQMRLSSEKIYLLTAFTILCAVFGARLAYFLINYGEFSYITDFFLLWKGGLSGVGALIGGLFAVFLFSKLQKIDFLKLADFIVPYIALCFAIGRIGCFLRGCCFGLPTNLPWGILYGKDSLAYQSGFTVPLHPTQLYLALGNLIIFFILLKANEHNEKKQKERKHGSTLFLFLALFSAQRFLIDFIRYYPESNYMGNFTVFQIGYSMIFICAVFLLFLRRRLKF